jgi:biotin operon repressor
VNVDVSEKDRQMAIEFLKSKKLINWLECAKLGKGSATILTLLLEAIFISKNLFYINPVVNISTKDLSLLSLCSQRTINKRIKELKELGIINVKHTYNKLTKKTINAYSININALHDYGDPIFENHRKEMANKYPDYELGEDFENENRNRELEYFLSNTKNSLRFIDFILSYN